MFHVSSNKTLQKLQFTLNIKARNFKNIEIFFIFSRHSEMYEGVFVFHGNLGERPRRLYLFGQGSYDGKHQAILNV